MSAHSRRKGRKGEQDVVNLAKAAGLSALRTWQTAQSQDDIERRCDVRISGKPHQVKVRQSGFSALYDAIRNVDAAFIREDGKEWLVVLPADKYLRFLKLLSTAPEGR